MLEIDINKNKNKILFRLGTLVCISLLYLFSEVIFDQLRKKYDNEYFFEFNQSNLEFLLENQNLPENVLVKKVVVSGFFSDWSTESELHQLTQVNETLWQRTISLSPGDNQYKFVIFIESQEIPIWIKDINNPIFVQDSYGRYNSVARIPDINSVHAMFSVVFSSIVIFLALYYFLEYILRWTLHLCLPLRVKLALCFTLVIISSFVLLTIYNFYENRKFIKQGIIDSIHQNHLMLKSNGIDFENLAAQRKELNDSINRYFWDATVRVEKQKILPTQITLSNFAIFDSNFKLLTLNHRYQNIAQQEQRASMLGYSTTKDLFLNVIIDPALTKAKASKNSHVTFFSHPGNQVEKFETYDTRVGRNLLGFSSFIHPIILKNKIVGYYAGDIQVKLYGEELKRIVIVNLLFILLLSLLTYLLLVNIGSLITQYITDLAEWTKRIVEGDFQHQVNIQSNDEIQLLAENFEKMRFELEKGFNEIAEKNHLLEIEAYIDDLTKLPNRKKMFLDLSQNPVESLILLNIDSFKNLNDFFGNEVGDYILLTTASRISQYQNTDIVKLYHIGGDEFVMTLSQKLSQKKLHALLNEICDMILCAPYQIKENEIYISLTAGVAIESGVESESKLLHGQAEKALQEAKSELVRFKLYEPSMESFETFENNMTWANRIRNAINEDRVIPYFQPIRNNLTGKVEKYECLVRIVENEGILVLPDAFLEVSKIARLYPFITQIMLDKSLLEFRNSNYELNINLSIEDILDTQTCQGIIDSLKLNSRITQHVVFEIIETSEIKNYDTIRRFIRQVKEFGCKIAIDDFGTGYSNFSHILGLNPDYIKIDGSLICNLDHDRNTQTITQTICEFANKMGVETIAEYVNSEAILQKCIEYGITFSQGYYIGEPVSHIDN